jgi:hypothetical protein
MSRRSTPERIHQAGRTGTVGRLTLEGELPDRAEALVAAWEAQEAKDGLERDGRWWGAAWEWMLGQRHSDVARRRAART